MAVYEDKYIVLKKEYLNQNLSDAEVNTLLCLIKKAVPEAHHYYVVNQDEPYADKVWDLISESEVFKHTSPSYSKKSESKDSYDVTIYAESSVIVRDTKASSVIEAASQAVQGFYEMHGALEDINLGPVGSCIVKKKNKRGDVYSFNTVPSYALLEY